jgi:hypothetical protein
VAAIAGIPPAALAFFISSDIANTDYTDFTDFKIRVICVKSLFEGKTI